jgi:hypothetical protein
MTNKLLEEEQSVRPAAASFQEGQTSGASPQDESVLFNRLATPANELANHVVNRRHKGRLELTGIEFTFRGCCIQKLRMQRPLMLHRVGTGDSFFQGKK